MGYRVYPDYKESGIEWFREIPSDWTVHRLKMLASEPLKYGANEAADLEDPSLPRFIRITDVNSDGSLNPDTFRSLPEKTAEPFLLEDGDILLARSGATVGKSFIYSPEWGKAAYAGYLIRLRTNQNVLHKRFAYYFFQSSPYWANIDSELIQATIQNFSAEKYSVIWIPTPRIDNQVTIAQFLDYKTAQIDRLIDKKQQLIEKLQEQHIAIITQAVTKGLAPEAPMKKTEISWLGAMPSTWEVSPLKRIISEDTRNGLYKEKDQFIADGTPFVQMGEAFAEPEFKQTAKDRVNTTQSELLKWGLLEGDLLFTRRSLVFEGSGKCVIIGKLQEPHLFESSMIRVRIDTQKALPQFVFHYFQSAFSRAEILATTKTVTISGIDSQQLKGLTVCLPDIKTQGEIVDFISKSSEKFSAAITANSTTIERLQEYRTALITAAVTGQIDVRDWQAPEPTKQLEADKEVA